MPSFKEMTSELKKKNKNSILHFVLVSLGQGKSSAVSQAALVLEKHDTANS